jgi:NADH-quinone oxidoreductase subunit J
VNAELVVFVIFAIAAFAGAFVLVMARNPVYSAMGLLMTMFSMAVFYILNEAPFIAAVQVLIYAGAVMTLFLFVIMFIGVDKSFDPKETIPFQRPIAIVLGVGLFVLLALAAQGVWVTGSSLFAGEALGTIENVSDELFGNWLLPFEATVLLLTIAAVGTVALARFEISEPRPVAEVVALDEGGAASPAVADEVEEANEELDEASAEPAASADDAPSEEEGS